MKLIEKYKPIILLFVAIIITTLSLVFALKYLLPLVLGAIVAFLIDPIVCFVERKTPLDRSLVVVIVLTGIFCLLGYFSILIIGRFTFELGNMITSLPKHHIYYNMVIDRVSSYFIDFSTKIPEEVLIYIQGNINQIISTVVGSLSNIYSFLVNRIGKVPNFFIRTLIILIFVFLFSYFLSKDKKRIVYTISENLHDSLKEKVKTIQIELFLSFFRLIKAQMILVMISTVITIIGFYILGIDYALTLGLICGLLDMLPLVGPSLIFIPWIIFLFIIGEIYAGFKLLFLYITVIVSRQIFQAKIIGQNLGIDPLLTLISIYLGIELYGVLGLFIGPIVVVIVKALAHSGIIPPLNKSK